MDGSTMKKLADALGGAGFVIKKIEDDVYSSFDKQEDGVKYNGEFTVKIRPISEEEIEQEKIQARKKAEWERMHPTEEAA
jgi:hypothetical protein